MQPFGINSHGRMVFPSNFRPDLDFTVLDSLEQLDEVIRRDFEAKAPTGTEILTPDRGGRPLPHPLRADARRRAEPVLGQPLRDDDVREAADALARRAAPPRRRVPAGADAVGGRRAQGRRRADALRRAAGRPGTAQAEDEIFAILFDVLRHRRHHATELPAVKPTVAEILAEPGPADLLACPPTTPTTRSTATRRSSTAPRTCPSSRRCTAGRWCCTTSTRGTGAQTRLTAVGELRDDDYVVVFHAAQPRGARLHPPGARGEARPPAPRPPRRGQPPSRRCAVPAGAGARAVRRDAAARGAGGGQGRARCAPTRT